MFEETKVGTNVEENDENLRDFIKIIFLLKELYVSTIQGIKQSYRTAIPVVEDIFKTETVTRFLVDN